MTWTQRSMAMAELAHERLDQVEKEKAAAEQSTAA
jgi:hypothetical protein